VARIEEGFGEVDGIRVFVRPILTLYRSADPDRLAAAGPAWPS
jgi:hypothetical protein